MGKINRARWAALLAAAFLAACGGGGDDSPAAPAATNPFLKAVGTLRACNQDHTALVLTVDAVGSSQAAIQLREEWFSNANCTGSVIAIFAAPSPATYTSAGPLTTVVVNVSGGRETATIETATASIPAQTATLTGSAVFNGRCVRYGASSQSCYDNLAIPAETSAEAVRVVGTTIIFYELEGSTYVEVGRFTP